MPGGGERQHADGRARRRACRGHDQREFRDAVRRTKCIAAARPPVQEESADQGLQRVAEADRRRGDKCAGGRDVSREGAEEDGRQDPLPAQQHQPERKPRRRPDRRGARVDGSEGKAGFRQREVKNGDDHQFGSANKRPIRVRTQGPAVRRDASILRIPTAAADDAWLYPQQLVARRRYEDLLTPPGILEAFRLGAKRRCQDQGQDLAQSAVARSPAA